MKRITLISIFGISAIAGLAIFAAFEMGDKSPIVAEGDVQITEGLVKHARGIRTLFIIVYDEDSPMPMPYGAIKISLTEDARGSFYHFKLTRDNLKVMNPSAPAPKSIRLKARLDLDSQGGRAQPGDLVAERANIPFGSVGVELNIDQKVE